jgi:ferritin-like metal-binding protein YciE
MIKDLKDLFFYHLQNLHSSEKQMLKALPSLIEKVQHDSLKNALKHHLKVTKEQKERLDKTVDSIKNEQQIELNQDYVSKGMTALIEEANDILEGGLEKDVTDAAIIACIQKMEHYEISCYGTTIAYARQLHLNKESEILSESLQEEYDTDDLLTALATASFNKEAMPENLQQIAEANSDTDVASEQSAGSDSQVHITERTINSPGGRAGTSHRGYGSGESRGH